MSIYSIGARAFDDLRGAIWLPTPNHETEHRPGQDGLSVHSTGRRGREFELVSSVYASSWADAAALGIVYHADPSLAPLNIVRGTETYAATSIRFVCLGVTLEPVREIVSWSGLRVISSVLTRVTVSPAFLVTARWQLVAIDTSLAIGYTPAPPP
ncbi:MAG: hypothetical protein ACK5S6_03920 [bacterium]